MCSHGLVALLLPYPIGEYDAFGYLRPIDGFQEARQICYFARLSSLFRQGWAFIRRVVGQEEKYVDSEGMEKWTAIIIDAVNR
jgi:hypothetical protein